jgi:virulence-associated protein VagC
MTKPMFTTHVFADEAGQFVVIPDEIAFDDLEKDLEITRCGDVITIRPTTAAMPETDVVPNQVRDL